MNVVQLTVTVTDEPGAVSHVTDVLGNGGIDIRGFSIADADGAGVLRLIVDQPGRAAGLLRDRSLAVEEHDVVVVQLDDHPGGLAAVLKTVTGAGITVRYIYSLISAHVVLDVDDADRARELLGDSTFDMLGQEDVGSL
jgi:hypothetical protein